MPAAPATHDDGDAADDATAGAEHMETKEEEEEDESWAMQDPNYAPWDSLPDGPGADGPDAGGMADGSSAEPAAGAEPSSSLLVAWPQGLGQSHHGEVGHGPRAKARAGERAAARAGARARASPTEAIVVAVVATSRRAQARARDRATSAGMAMMRRMAGTTMVLHQRVIWHIYLLDFNT